MRVLIYSVLALAMSTTVKGQGYTPTEEELEAIRKVETGGCRDPLNAEGDGGLSIGPYQIMRNYYVDAKEQDPSVPSYESLKGPDSISNSERVMQAYSDRYTTEARLGREPTFEDFARNHNGGPNGYKKDSTIDYYDKVESNLPNRKKRTTGNAGGFLGCPSRATNTVALQAFVIFLGIFALTLLF